MNDVQRASVARFLYDLSKGALLAALVGLITSKVAIIPAIAAVLFAANCFRAGYMLEGVKNELDCS